MAKTKDDDESIVVPGFAILTVRSGLECQMAKDIAARFVAGRKIPKRLEWR